MRLSVSAKKNAKSKRTHKGIRHRYLILEAILFDILSFMSICDPYGTPEHIIVPGIGLGIFTKSCSQKICPVGKKIHAERFYQREKAGLEKNRLAFGKKAFKGLVDEAYKSIKEIENINAELDKIYLPHTQIKALIASVLRTVLGSD